ncbi:MAG: hypothetical protein LC620_06470 [Halobacteriales archaeon]|nr:hypothetical protein [Halobacteriales archaeon]
MSEANAPKRATGHFHPASFAIWSSERRRRERTLRSRLRDRKGEQIAKEQVMEMHPVLREADA